MDITPLRVLDHLLPGHHVTIQTNSVDGHWQAAIAGLGVALLPRYLGDPDPRLVRVLPDTVQVGRTYWLAIPKECLRLDRVRAAVTLLDQIVAERRCDQPDR